MGLLQTGDPEPRDPHSHWIAGFASASWDILPGWFQKHFDSSSTAPEQSPKPYPVEEGEFIRNPHDVPSGSMLWVPPVPSLPSEPSWRPCPTCRLPTLYPWFPCEGRHPSKHVPNPSIGQSGADTEWLCHTQDPLWSNIIIIYAHQYSFFT